MVLFEAGKLEHKNYVSIRDLRELRGIEETSEGVTLGFTYDLYRGPTK